MSPLDATNASFIMGFIVLVSSRRETPSQYGEGRNISVSRLRHLANHNFCSIFVIFCSSNCPVKTVDLISQNCDFITHNYNHFWWLQPFFMIATSCLITATFSIVTLFCTIETILYKCNVIFHNYDLSNYVTTITMLHYFIFMLNNCDFLSHNYTLFLIIAAVSYTCYFIKQLWLLFVTTTFPQLHI